jgi:hypothetical protein
VSAWHDIEALAAEEADLVADGRFEELPAIAARRALLLAALPRPLPPEAVEPLRRSLEQQRATVTAMAARRDAIGAELGALRQRRTGVRGYQRTFDARP